MADTKETKNIKRNFPCSTLEEMLRMMRECQENGNIDCEKVMKEFMGKDFKSIDYKQIKKKLFGEESK